MVRDCLKHQSKRWLVFFLGSLLFLLSSESKAGWPEKWPIVTGPIVVRCLEKSPCEHIPQGLVEADRQLRESLVLPEDSKLKQAIEWSTESTPGIILLFVLLIFILQWRWRFSAKDFLRWIQTPSSYAKLVLGVGLLGIANETSDRLKLLIGRLKPHVNFVNPNPEILPALSLPSNHSFNTAFLMGCLWYLSRKSSEKEHGRFHLLLAAVAFAIGGSRVLVGEHYPLDVITGLTLGLLLSLILCEALSKLWPLLSNRTTK